MSKQPLPGQKRIAGTLCERWPCIRCGDLVWVQVTRRHPTECDDCGRFGRTPFQHGTGGGERVIRSGKEST